MQNAIFRAGASALIALVVLLAVAEYVGAQTASTTAVTDDQVNAIAHKLYCPVCENITLDTCGTAACADWRYEIRLQLEAGRTEEQIITDFVQRFGDRVVGTPQDSVLRALSLFTPWLLIGVVLVILGSMVMARQRRQAQSGTVATSAGGRVPQEYEDILERDLES